MVRRIHRTEKCILAALLCGVFILAPQYLRGQGVTTAKVVGTITDPTGGAVPNASVSVANVGTNEVFQTSTNGAGNYEAILTSGSYTLSVEAPGFQKAQAAPFTLTVGQVARLDVELKVGVITQQVQVEATAVGLQTEEASVSSVIGGQETEELPLNGRSFIQLAWLTPGVNMGTPGSITARANRGSLGQQVSMESNGVRDTQNRFYYDGIQSMDMGNATYSFSVSVDAIQEFRVETSTYSAATGGAPGGQVNLMTKSGTNLLHGTLWEFNRNNDLSALEPFTPAGPNRATQRLNRNQFGANLGGPVYIPKLFNGKDRTFFFFNWESGRLITGLAGGAAASLLPPAAYRTGDFSGCTDSCKIYDPLTGQQFSYNGVANVIPPNRIASFASKYLTFIPEPNTSGPGINYRAPASVAPTDQDQYVARIDHRVSDRNYLFGAYMYNNLPVYAVPSYTWDAANSKTLTQNLSMGDTHSFSPTVVNEARIGWNRLKVFGTFGTTDNPALNIANIIGIAGASTDPYDYGAPSFGVGGYTMPTNTVNGPASRMDQIWQGSDSVSIQKGKHGMHVGVDVIRRNWTFIEAPYARGTFSFDGRVTTLNGAPALAENNFAAFLLGGATSGEMSPLPFETRLNDWWDDAYFQDDWKVTRNLTLNWGLRYDFFSPNTQRGALTNFALNGVIPGYVPSQQLYHDVPGYTNTPGYPAALTYPDRRDWGPRIGFAWRVPGWSDFVVRGGYGIYYTPEITNSYTDLTLGAPIIPTYSITTTYSAPIPANTMFAALPTSATGYFVGDFIIDPHNRSTYNEEWNVTAQKRLRGNVFVDLGYVGSEAHRLVESFDGNRPIQVISWTGPEPAVNPRRPFQPYGSLSEWKAAGNSTYNALQMKVEHPVSHGFTLLGSYTWSNALSNSDASSVGGGSYIGGIQDIYHNALDKSWAAYDQRHRLSIAAIYQLPSLKGSGRPMRTALGGWQLGTIITEQTGAPAGVSGPGDTTGTGVGSRPNIVAGQDPMLPRSQRTDAKWFNTAAFSENVPIGTWGDAPRTNIHLPGFNNVDASLFKNFRFGETRNVQFRAEFFNFFNHVNLGAPGLNPLAPASYGIVTSSTQGAGYPGDKRIVQFGLKLQF